MKMEIKVLGCPFEEQESLKTFAFAMDYASALSEARQEIRSRLKWGEDLTKAEVDFLEKLQDILYIEGPEW